MYEIHTYMYMPPLTIFCFTIIAHVGQILHVWGSKFVFLKNFLDRSASFSARKLMSMPKTIKKRWRQKVTFCRKNTFKKRYMFLMFSSDFHISDPQLTF